MVIRCGRVWVRGLAVEDVADVVLTRGEDQDAEHEAQQQRHCARCRLVLVLFDGCLFEGFIIDASGVAVSR